MDITLNHKIPLPVIKINNHQLAPQLLTLHKHEVLVYLLYDKCAQAFRDEKVKLHTY